MRNILTLVLALCACGKTEPKPEPSPADAEIRARAAQVEERILGLTEPRGWVVSKHIDGSIEHTGDSLIWTGMAMGVMSCAGGAAPEAALLEILQTNNGRFLRHPTLPSKETSLDGHIGVYWGIAQRVRRCPESSPLWVAALATHEPVNLKGPFEHLLSSLKYQLGMGGKPNVAALTDTVAAWAYGVVLSKSAGFRIHLGLLSLQTLEHAGVGLPAGARTKFCSASDGSGLTTTDHWCGRGDLAGWVKAFEFNRYEYAHQRAEWENADGRPGLVTPGLDLLVALSDLYQL